MRFAGSRLAAAGNDEELLPVRLRLGERSMGGALSWTTPQPVTEFPATGPFADLAAADRGHRFAPGSGRADAGHRRAHLGEPRRRHAAGHRRPARQRARWCCSMSRRKRHGRTCRSPAASSRCCAASCSCRATRARRRQLPKARSPRSPPYRMIAANGALVPPTPDAQPLIVAAPVRRRSRIENPPGLYGTEEGVFAHNLLTADARFAPLVRPHIVSAGDRTALCSRRIA